MRIAKLVLMLGLTLGVSVGCGGDEEAAETSAETTAADPEAPPAAEEEAAPAAPTTYSCLLANHCREYSGLPYTLTEGERTMEITLAMVQGECSMRQGTWSEAPCSDEGVLATCAEDHMVWHYREGADLAMSEDLCNNVRHGTWATP